MKRRVLIIEDDAQMRDMLAVSLRRRDFDATCCESATTGLEALSASKFDVVVTDINMRGLDGIEFCKRVASSHPDLPVIVITAFGSMDSAIAALRAGAVDFIPKPFELDTLAAAIERHSDKPASTNGRSAFVEELEKETEFVTLDDLERRYILRVVEALNGNRSLAAQTLGLDRKTLYRKLLLYSGKTKNEPSSQPQAAAQDK